jgi:DNA topoisomerase-1
LTAGEALDLIELLARQHWTKPPPRYTEASLIRELERRGIGRPSTFAGMVALILRRNYVRKEARALLPTELGFTVCDLLVEGFSELFDYPFTAQMEDQLDDIANGRAQRLATLQSFWDDLSASLNNAETGMPSVHIQGNNPAEPTGQKCPECGSDLVRRKGRYGVFVGCASYPKCTYVQAKPNSKPTGQTCPVCGSELVIRKGKHGPFLGCSAYPDCKYTASIKSRHSQPNQDIIPEGENL